MAKADQQKEQAKALFLKGVSITEIADRLNIARRTVQRWKQSGDWEALESSLPKPERPNVVSFERPRTPEPPQPKPTVKLSLGLYDSLEGQLSAIDEMLDYARAEAASPTTAQGFGQALSGFSKLLQLRNSLLPVDDEALLDELLQRYKGARSLVKRLRAAGYQA